MKNITSSVKIVDLFPERSSLAYVDYIVQDGEKPEHIAHRVYGKSDYHWIVLHSNQIVDPFFDWPKSSVELENHIKIQYPGIAMFFDPIGIPAFKIGSSTSKLPPQKSHFVNGEMISQIQNSLTITGNILRWDPTLRKLEVTDTSSGAFLTTKDVYSTNPDGIDITTRPSKIVYDNAESLHHFVDDFGNILDPYGKINYYEYDDRKVYSTSNVFVGNSDGLPTATGATSTNDFALNKYINGGSQAGVITNRMYENDFNDKKRKIKILKVEYVEKLANQLAKAFQ